MKNKIIRDMDMIVTNPYNNGEWRAGNSEWKRRNRSTWRDAAWFGVVVVLFAVAVILMSIIW